jgi:hypothetical protein
MLPSIEWCGHSHDCDCKWTPDVEEMTAYIKKHKDSEWWKCVKNRINQIGFYFPAYIKHELLDLLN